MWYASWQKKATPHNLSPIVTIEENRGVWFVTWRKPRSRTRFLPSQIALYEAQRADQRGDVELAARLRWAATEAQSRNAPDRH
jgi:hypothetical protein